MEFLKWCAVLMALYVAFPVYAACPPGVQETVIFYINGVDNTEKKANDSATALENALKTHSDYNSECVTVKAAYNHDQLFKLDLVENVILKAEDLLGIPFSNAMALFYRVPPSAISGPAILAFDDAMRGSYDRNTGTVDLVQRDEHIKYYDPVLKAGKRIILVSHSQGGFYANLEWEELTPAQKNNTDIVTVVTPSDHVSDGGEKRNTRLKEDLIAFFTFPFALLPDPPDFSNTEPCGNIVTQFWRCHGFIESYMHGTNSRTKIVNDIVALLPVAPPTGTPTTLFGLVRRSGNVPVPGVRIVVCRIAAETDQSCGTILTETTSGSNGLYQTASFPECTPCAVEASVMIGDSLYTAFQTITSLPAGSGNLREDITVTASQPATVFGFLYIGDAVVTGASVSIEYAEGGGVVNTVNDGSGLFVLHPRACFECTFHASKEVNGRLFCALHRNFFIL